MIWKIRQWLIKQLLKADLTKNAPPTLVGCRYDANDVYFHVTIEKKR